LKLQVTFHFWKLLIWLQNLQGSCLTWWIGLFWTWMKCLKSFLHLLALSSCIVDCTGPQMTLPCPDQLEPQPLEEFAQKWNPSSYKLNIMIMWSSSSTNTSFPWETLVERITLIRVDQRSKP
jgi:hypothetical protein